MRSPTLISLSFSSHFPLRFLILFPFAFLCGLPLCSSHLYCSDNVFDLRELKPRFFVEMKKKQQKTRENALLCAVFVVFKHDFAPFLNVSRETMRENPQKTPKTREKPTRNTAEAQEKTKRNTRENHENPIKPTQKDKARVAYFTRLGRKSHPFTYLCIYQAG